MTCRKRKARLPGSSANATRSTSAFTESAQRRHVQRRHVPKSHESHDALAPSRDELLDAMGAGLAPNGINGIALRSALFHTDVPGQMSPATMVWKRAERSV